MTKLVNKKYLCTVACSIRRRNKSIYVPRDKVITATSNPNKRCFTCITDNMEAEEMSYSIDFELAEEAELMAADWKVTEAENFIREKYKAEDFEFEKPVKKSEVVRKILDLRFRAID